VGSGSLADKIKEAGGLDTRIHYLGYKSGKELADVYRMCDVFVFPTLQPEQHPLVIKEALASGMFVLCSSSLHGIFDDFEAKSFLEYVNPDLKSVSQAMKAAISSVDAIRKLRFNIARSAEIYDWKNITEHLFQKIIDITEKKFKD
jgi:glycosyltransferase involved in cell wall biosynthesis